MGWQVLLLTEDEEAETAEEAVRNLIERIQSGSEYNFDVRPEGASLEVEPIIISSVEAYSDFVGDDEDENF